MKGHSKWSYSPYVPPMTEVGDIYICRIVPGEYNIYFEWLDSGSDVYEIFIRRSGDQEYSYCGKSEICSFNITGLCIDTDYEFYVCSGSLRSRVRLARCAHVDGSVVNYLHPDDEAYAFSGRYLCSPSFVNHPDGYLLASMDLFNHRDAQNLTLIFRSDDNGETWKYQCELMPCFWGKLFIHKNDVYMLSCSTEFGDLLIGKSVDGGKTFDTPVVLFRGSNGKLGKSGFHKNPQNIVRHKGRIYETLEWACWDDTRKTLGKHGAMVMSCDENDDILIPENWSFSEPKAFCPADSPLVASFDETSTTIEGTLVVSPENKLLNVMRFTNDGYAIMYEVDSDNPEEKLKFYDLMKFDAHLSKFMILYDEKSRKYITIANYIYDYKIKRARNLLCLMQSDDLKEWKITKILHDRRNEDWFYSGIQYASFEFDGDDIIYLARTAINNPHNYHDANYSVFHRIEKFRDLL